VREAHVIDLRSDTSTRPSPEMLAAMVTAEVGDDVYGDDPTVNALQEQCAALLDKEAALFVPSGSMGNLTALAAQVASGEEVLCEEAAHVLNYEAGGLGLFGIMSRSLPSRRALVDLDALDRALRPGDDHSPRSAALVLEITHATLGGLVPDFDATAAVADRARVNRTAVHLDGARLFNATVASGIPAAQWSALADTVTFCFSKGLGAPAGAMVLGDAATVERARLVRKRLGGAMRQAGLLAAAARVGLDHGIALLADDHRRARDLARGIATLLPDALDPDLVQTNIIQFEPVGAGLPAVEIVARLAEHSILAKTYGGREVRFVTHRDITDADLPAVLDALRAVLDRV
jgi:threonine aldolase